MSESRWTFMSRKVIGPDDNPMLIRWQIIQTPFGGVYLHFIHREDLDRMPHDHPWTFLTWVIRGSYVEEFWKDSRLIGKSHTGGFLGRVLPVTQQRKRWSLRIFRKAAAHRIIKTEGKVTTLVVVGPKTRTWGFYLENSGTFVDWRDYHRVIGQKAW